MAELPIAAVDRLIRKVDPQIRVSDTASSSLAELLEDYGLKVAKSAAEFSKHAKRKTITEEDIKLAAKNI